MILATLLQWCASCTDADQIGAGLGILTGAGGAVAATGALGGLLGSAVDPGQIYQDTGGPPPPLDTPPTDGPLDPAQLTSGTPGAHTTPADPADPDHLATDTPPPPDAGGVGVGLGAGPPQPPSTPIPPATGSHDSNWLTSSGAGEPEIVSPTYPGQLAATPPVHPGADNVGVGLGAGAAPPGTPMPPPPIPPATGPHDPNWLATGTGRHPDIITSTTPDDLTTGTPEADTSPNPGAVDPSETGVGSGEPMEGSS